MAEPLIVSFNVAGLPIPQGSMRKSRHGTIIHSDPAVLKTWRNAIGWTARQQLPRPWSKAGGFEVGATFYLPRPASLPKRVTLPIAHKNDVDKLARALLDGMSQIVYDDDGQVTDLNVRKRFGAPGVAVSVVRMQD